MQSKKWSGAILSLAFVVLSTGCGTGSSSGSVADPNPTPQPQSGTVSLILSDASSEDWAGINVKILSIALVPQGGGSNVTIYTCPNPAPGINLVQLDQLGEILGNVSVPAGSYSGAQLTIGGNPGDVSLVPGLVRPSSPRRMAEMIRGRVWDWPRISRGSSESSSWSLLSLAESVVLFIPDL